MGRFKWIKIKQSQIALNRTIFTKLIKVLRGRKSPKCKIGSHLKGKVKTKGILNAHAQASFLSLPSRVSSQLHGFAGFPLVQPRGVWCVCTCVWPRGISCVYTCVWSLSFGGLQVCSQRHKLMLSSFKETSLILQQVSLGHPQPQVTLGLPHVPVSLSWRICAEGIKPCVFMSASSDVSKG